MTLPTKTIFLLEKNILLNKLPPKEILFILRKKINDIAEVVEDIVESVNENVKDMNIIDVNGEFIASLINSYLTVDPNLLDLSNMEDNIALIKAELRALKSFVTEELYNLFSNMDRIRAEYDQSKILEKNTNLRAKFQVRIYLLKCYNNIYNNNVLPLRDREISLSIFESIITQMFPLCLSCPNSISLSKSCRD